MRAGRWAGSPPETKSRTIECPIRSWRIEAALTAFEDGFYYMFVNDRQVERLDQVVDQRDVTDVLFVRLTPLAGG